MAFDTLSTEQFRQRLHPAAIPIYQSIFPDCSVRDLRTEGAKVHLLDKEFGIDTLISLSSEQDITVQEKYRTYDNLIRFGDFTQEYMNAVGSPFEAQGEWFKLGAQLYFYGWSNAQETDFAKWFIMDVVQYKLLIERVGGLDRIGTLRYNLKHGKATFYSIALDKLDKVILFKSW